MVTSTKILWSLILHVQTLIAEIQLHHQMDKWSHHWGPGTLTQPLTAVTLATLCLGPSTGLMELMETGPYHNLIVY